MHFKAKALAVPRQRAGQIPIFHPNGLLMVELDPELKYILADQPPVPELPPQDAQARFQLVFRRFIGAFSRPGHPLALFLDDLQWLDAATRLKIFEGDAALESADAAAAAPEALLDDCVPRPRFAVDLLKFSDGVTGRIIEVLRRAAFQAIADKPQKVGPQQLQYVGAHIPAVIGRRS
jgi:AAA ATPase domain